MIRHRKYVVIPPLHGKQRVSPPQRQTVRQLQEPLNLSDTSHSQAPQDYTEAYHILWAELHTKADPTPDWFSSWLNRIPCGTCRSTARRILEKLKPRYDDWFAFSVELHNAVNAKLNKPQLTIEEASRIWRK